MKIFLKQKKSNSCSKNKEWAYEKVQLTISTFKLPLNKKTQIETDIF